MGTTCITSGGHNIMLVTVAQTERELDANNWAIKQRTGCC